MKIGYIVSKEFSDEQTRLNDQVGAEANAFTDVLNDEALDRAVTEGVFGCGHASALG